MFNYAIVRTPSQAMLHGLTEANLGPPDYHLALAQHQGYIEALESCGLTVVTLPALEAFPDACFVEDVALLTPHCAILTHPGAPSRRGEVEHIEAAVRQHYHQIHRISPQGHLEAGDVMMVGSHFYIGLSARTDMAGAQELIAILEQYGMRGSVVTMSEMLHLKTGINYLENNRMLAFGEMLTHPAFAQFERIAIQAHESYAANCVWINGTVLVPAGFPETLATVQALGYHTREVAVSEFQKLDGGLSCLSLRF
ncbi:MAG TPA: arginine deiminase family protein [Pseudomonadales bacterium]|nr:arginine deiminase family protein [Pseudomonadales bacterium]